MSDSSIKIPKQLNLVPAAGTSRLTETADMGYDSSADKLAIYTDSAPDYFVTENKVQTLTNKTLTSAVLSAATLNNAILNNPTINMAVISLDDQSSAFKLTLRADSNQTADRTLTFNVNDADREFDLQGNITLQGDLLTEADFSVLSDSIELTAASGGSSVTLPSTGTLATLANSETFTNKILAAPLITSPDIDGQTASNTSRITLPKNTKSNLDGLTRKQATLMYATDEDTVYVDDGSSLNPIAGGSYKSYANENIANNGTVTLSLITGLQYRRVTGSGGPITASSTPLGSSAPNDGTAIILAGQSDENTVTFISSDVAKGFLLNGDCTLGLGQTLHVLYDATLDRYVEISRNSF